MKNDMALASTSALREALAIRVRRCLPPAIWDEVFMQQRGCNVLFEEHRLTLLHADPEMPLPAPEAALLQNGLRALAASHHGKTDYSAVPSSLTLLRHPVRALHMAVALRRRMPDIRFRVGIHTALCRLGIFEAQERHWVVVLGPERERAASLAWSARAGVVSLCPESHHALRGEPLLHESSGTLLTQTFDGGALVRASFTVPPQASDAECSTRIAA